MTSSFTALLFSGDLCSCGDVYRWLGSAVAQVLWVVWGMKGNTAKRSCPTGAEEEREMEIYQERSVTGKLSDQGQVSGRHLLTSHRTGILPKGCTGLGY